MKRANPITKEAETKYPPHHIAGERGKFRTFFLKYLKKIVSKTTKHIELLTICELISIQRYCIMLLCTLYIKSAIKI